MSRVSTKQAAEQMLSTGKYYTAAELARELGVSAKEASGFLYNIRTTRKYSCRETKLPNRKVKLESINGRKQTIDNLWRLALFGHVKHQITQN